MTRMTQILTIILLCGIFISCGKGTKTENLKVTDSKPKTEITENCYPEKFKHDNRQTIYKTIDQRSYYNALIKPIIDSLKIKTISGNSKEGVLSFKIDTTIYSIDTKQFSDGVIFFQPNKKPILWTLDCNTKTCSDRSFISNYFK